MLLEHLDESLKVQLLLRLDVFNLNSSIRGRAVPSRGTKRRQELID